MMVFPAPVLSLCLWLVFCVALASSFLLEKTANYTLVLSSLESDLVKEYVQLVYTGESWDVLLIPDGDIDYNEVYCVGIESRPDLQCINYKRVTPNPDIWIYVSENNDIQQLSISKSELVQGAGAKLTIQKVVQGAIPKASPKLVKTVEDGTTTFAEETVPEKSFVQKYWMYMVPPLVIYLLLTENGSRQQ